MKKSLKLKQISNLPVGGDFLDSFENNPIFYPFVYFDTVPQF